MNLLLTTLGSSWGIVPELLAFTNPAEVPLFAEHPEAVIFQKWRNQHSITPVNEVWVATTGGTPVQSALNSLQVWYAKHPGLPVLRVFRSPGIVDLGSIEECRWMRDLIFRLALHGRQRSQDSGGNFLISLAGGRKTMSADAQLGYELFGGDALLHVVDLGRLPDALRSPDPSAFYQPLSPNLACHFSPIIVRGVQPGNPTLRLPEAAIRTDRFALPELARDDFITEVPNSTDLVEKVEATLAEANNLLLNFTEELLRTEGASNFRALYTLPPDTIAFLRNDRIGIHPDRAAKDLAWIQSLPKAELHCHLGGILDAADTLEVAESIAPAISETTRVNRTFRELQSQFHSWQNVPVESIHAELGEIGWKSSRDLCGTHLRDQLTASFILNALGDPHRLDQFLFGEWLNQPETFRGIGIRAYETIGDLQGSSLLQSPAALAAAATCLSRICSRHNIRYCEVRCSPLNCTLGGMSPLAVIQNLTEHLRSPATTFRLIFIASRHGRAEAIQGHVDLVLAWQKDDPLNFQNWFAGFDLAGDESVASPASLRECFKPIRENCLQITIHAGEGETPRNIWEATHELNAERIGHGLTLGDRPDLIDFLRRRRVTIELCPSSNDQIVGFRDFRPGNPSTPEGRIYPLHHYLQKGLRVCLNTDDPGMSRTDLSKEFIKAAHLSPEGLSRWEVLHLIRNSFQAAFAPPETRRDLLLNAERTILRQILQS